jgi:hypothetical protein
VDGKAWQEIAAGLHLSRDQVARRASRLGLKRGMSFKDAARRVRAWDRRRTTFHIHTREIKKPAARNSIVPNWVFRVERSKTYEIPRAKHNVTFFELEPHHCRYPIGVLKPKNFVSWRAATRWQAILRALLRNRLLTVKFRIQTFVFPSRPQRRSCRGYNSRGRSPKSQRS